MTRRIGVNDDLVRIPLTASRNHQQRSEHAAPPDRRPAASSIR